MSDDEERATDPALDFLSVSFDPLKALQCSPDKVQLPHPSVQPCDNLQAYTSVVEGKRREPRPHTPPVEQVALPQARRQPPTRKPVKTVFDFMERENPGPFSLLQKSRVARRHIRVTIRHCVGVRGMCEGVPVVYDKYMNIVLADVTEWCTPFRTVANGGITLSKKQRQRKKRSEQLQQQEEGEGVDLSGTVGDDKKWEVCRTVKQLFIRGDNIIHISSIQCGTLLN